SVGDFKVTNRTRFEFRHFNDRKDDVRFRNETRIEAPWSITPLDIRPYFEEEFFISFNEDEVNMNWITLGLFYKPVKNIKLKAGYRWLTQKLGGEWRDRHIFVTAFNFYY
ncbi:MAG: DUF2490 domain-containing protein, partial [Verrucomicrobiota bacterium]